jgi:hypothetical protein
MPSRNRSLSLEWFGTHQSKSQSSSLAYIPSPPSVRDIRPFPYLPSPLLLSPCSYVFPPTPQYHLQGPHPKPTTSIPNSVVVTDDTPLAPSPRVDRSRPKRSDAYRSSTQNADATTLRTPKVDDIALSILTIATPGDRGLSHL